MKSIKPISVLLVLSVLLFVLLSACNSEVPPAENQESTPSQPKIELPNEVIFFASDRDGKEAFYAVDVDGSNIREIKVEGLPSRALPTQPIWSKAAQKFFFTVRIDDDVDIYAMNWDGSGLENLTDSDYRWETKPVPSPNGEMIAFIGVETGQEIMVMKSNGEDVTNLSNYAGMNANIAWSPDSVRVYHSTNRSGTPNNYFVHADGSNLTNVTQGPGLDATFSLSPDGSQMAFASDRDGYMDIFVISTDGGEAINVTMTEEIREIDPKWSPDGELIAYRIMNEESGDSDIYVIKPDGSSRTQITDTPNVSESSISWSPDGQHLIYVSEIDGQMDIFIIKPDGSSDPVNISNNPGNDYGPKWVIVK
jgi:Tol biopolymer transport system component